MTSGECLTEEEKEKIREEFPSKSKRQLAKEMKRNRVTVRRFIQSEGLEDN